MHNNSLGRKTLSKTLFLVCPTDNMEQLILNNFKGEAFFYTALGVYFEFDFRTESRLWELICENGINQIIFVSTIHNIFYQHAYARKGKHNFPIDKVLAETKKKISKNLIQPEAFGSNFHLLAAKHLRNQKKRLLSSPYLGEHLKKEKIPVKAYVYEAHEKIFYHLREIEQRGYLLNSISNN